jgi:hypothetical protein
MRNLIYGSLFIIAAGMLSGCDSSKKPAPPQADKATDNTVFIMKSGGASVLKLTGPADFKCVAEDGALKFDTPKFYAEYWLAAGAHTVDEAVGRVATQIESEFKNFKPNKTTDLTIAGSPAKRMVGDGEEADDGDPGQADVIVFKVGDHVFVACDHGEKLSAAGQEGTLALTQTAQAP